jgi:hypothetical protein
VGGDVTIVVAVTLTTWYDVRCLAQPLAHSLSRGQEPGQSAPGLNVAGGTMDGLSTLFTAFEQTLAQELGGSLRDVRFIQSKYRNIFVCIIWHSGVFGRMQNTPSGCGGHLPIRQTPF